MPLEDTAEDVEVCVQLSWPWKEVTTDRQSADPTQILTTSAPLEELQNPKLQR